MNPEETPFWSGGEDVVFDDDVDVMHVLFWAASGDVIGVFPEREDAKKLAQESGVRDWQIEPAPANFDGSDYDYPDLP